VEKRAWLLASCLGLAGLAIGGLAVGAYMLQQPVYIPPLKVVGDVRHCLTIKSLDQIGPIDRIAFQGTSYRAARLADLIRAAGPVGAAQRLYLVGSDGFTAAIGAGSIADCHIAYTASNGWEAVNLDHPINSNAKSIAEIVVVAGGSDKDFGLGIIGPAADLARVTPGQMLTHNLQEYFYHEGDASVQNGGETYESSVYTIRRVFRLNDLIPAGEGNPILVVSADGAWQLVDNHGYFEVKENYIDYLLPDERVTVPRVRGVIVDPPAASIMNTYFDAQHYLENGEQVLVMILDGLTYRQYAYAVANGDAPFLKRAGTAVKALGVYPVAANVGFAAMITGKPPAENGIATADDRQLHAPSIFAEALAMKKRALLLDADRNPINTEVQPSITTGRNASETSDDELEAMALGNLDKGYDLIVVRFHSIADSRERYGPLADQAMGSIREIDRYVERMVAKWPGRVIIAADQGSWSGKLAGSQVDFSGDTMFVPYLLVSN